MKAVNFHTIALAAGQYWCFSRGSLITFPFRGPLPQQSARVDARNKKAGIGVCEYDAFASNTSTHTTHT